jgi:hypothetical protein
MSELGERTPFKDALPKPESLFPNTMKKLAKQPEALAAFHEMVTVEGLRQLAREATNDRLNYMSKPELYQRGHTMLFNSMLKPKYQEKQLVDQNAFWEALDPMRRLIVLHEVGKTVNVDLNKEAAEFRGQIQLGQSHIKTKIIHVEDPSIPCDILLEYNPKAENDQISYSFRKK